MLNTHIVRLGTHAEKDYLLRAYAWFDEVALNANLVEGTAGSLSLFVAQLRDKGKGYFIDPITYAFALSPNLLMRNGRSQPSRDYLKRTFQGLASQYGRVVDQVAGQIALQPTHWESTADQEEFCMRVLNYQRNRLNEALRQSEDFLMTESEIEPLTPTRLVAPYFHVSGDLDWLPVNISLASRAMQIEPASWVVVCLDSLLLDSQSLDEVIDAYSGLQTPGYLLWATDLEEERATEGQVQGLKRLITGLSQGGSKAVINMFGGYFSCLLSEDGLTGISHGLGYGERRDIVPVLGGGLPPPKYYLPPVHQGIRIDELVSIAINRDETSFRLEVCPCVICQGLLRQGVGFLLQQYTASSTKIVNGRYREVATPEVYRLTRFHYLHNKSLEFQRIRQTSREALLDALDTAYAQFRNDLGTASLMYLRTWRRALTP